MNLWELPFYVSVEKRKGAKEQLIFVSNVELKDPIEMYRLRWSIETMFSCLKTRGFRMEDTHITDPEKIEKVLFVLAIAFCWAYRIEDIQYQTCSIKLKAHERKAKSIFRKGLDLIRRTVFGGWTGRKFTRPLKCFTHLKSKSCMT